MDGFQDESPQRMLADGSNGEVQEPEAGLPELQRLWRAEPREARARRGLGIGIITYNRLATLQGCVAAIERHTKAPFHLVVADDGSSDGGAAWARECGIPIVTGRSAGCAWNKNRALSYLLRQTCCDPILLLEDDCWPAEDGWEEAWAEVARLHGHANFMSPFTRQYLLGQGRLTGQAEQPGSGTAHDPWRSLHVSAQCSVISRAVLEQVGFLDTRLAGWGFEHIEWTRRFLRLQHSLERTPSDLDYAAAFSGLRNGPEGLPRSPYAPPYLSLSSGLSMIDAGTFQNMEALRVNEATGLALLHEPTHREPYRSEAERERFEHEQARALWPLSAAAAHEGEAGTAVDGGGEPGTISVLCATRTPPLAHRMMRSILSSVQQEASAEAPRAPLIGDASSGIELEFVWAWNGVGSCPLPGVVAEYREPAFSYEEAINRAAMKSRGQVLVIINDDVVLNAPGLLARLLRLAQDHGAGAMYGGDHLGSFSTDASGTFDAREAPEAPGIAGCCWAIPRRAFFHMGGLEESLSEYGGDEMVTSVRLRRLGYRGLRLSGWRYGHALSATYGPGIWNTRHGHQISAALGYEGFPPEPNARTYEALRLRLLDREGINARLSLRHQA